MKRLFLVMVLAAGCATVAPPELVKARAEYQSAAKGPASTLARSELDQAHKYLDAAEQSLDTNRDEQVANDWAYIARRKIVVAQARALTRQEMHCCQADRLALKSAKEAELAKAQQDRMKQLESVAKVKEEPRGTVITLPGSVLFPFGKSNLSPVSRERLVTVSEAMKKLPEGHRLTVEGHTDSVGSEQVNMALSLARAIAVEKFLVEQGVPADIMDHEGYGESRPVVPNDTRENRAANRRVEIVVVKPQAVGAVGAR